MAAKILTKICPMFDWVLVQRTSFPKTVTESGIKLVQRPVREPKHGVVLAVGPGMRNPNTGKHFEPCLKAGDRVLLPGFNGRKIDVEGQAHCELYQESDILGKIYY
ncbi:10 kDa heat shock protein, mitochondrial-like [Teleopsis dalmanni]|uniref:10 kDa heat shock protein, mitochondrial-like n=1 Tax=Teleopsis dalmanni TaxID=139649 RepID=UPI0018CF7438|nr:10 kDa heat shock protein, mitochondrial-like [Teleopsis dalmanni]